MAYSVLAVLFLAAQASTNLPFGYAPRPPADAPELAQLGVQALNSARWGLYQVSWNSGLNALWRMFSPVHRFTWSFRIEVERADGSRVVLPLPNQIERTAFEATVIDYRETKFLLNMWNRPEFRWPYAEHLCRTYVRDGRGGWIRFWVTWQDIAPPGIAAATGADAYGEPRTSLLDQFPCTVAAR